MKQKQLKLKYGIPLTLIVILISQLQSTLAQAQNDTIDKKLLKYELSIDLVPVIDEGKFGKVYFKIKQFNGKQEKGALRLGVAEGTYWYSKNMPNQIITPSNETFKHFTAEVFLGYEKYKRVGRFLTYYGLDLSGRYFIREYDPHYSDDYRVFTVGLCPFLGIKQHISKQMSVAFEMGWENHINFFKDLHPDRNGFSSRDFHSDLRLPYNFTFNFHF